MEFAPPPQFPADVSPRVAEIVDGVLTYVCPGCWNVHRLPLAGAAPEKRKGGHWELSGGLRAPTIRPAVVASSPADHENGLRRLHCAAVVESGHAHFDKASTHLLAGRSAPLPPWPARVA